MRIVQVQSHCLHFVLLTLGHSVRQISSLIVTRSQFWNLYPLVQAGLIPSSLPPTLEIPLIFLPTAGCLAMSIVLRDSFRFYAVIDTGSPFLTAPEGAMEFSHSLARMYPATEEQYGESKGEMLWRHCRTRIRGLETPLVFGVPQNNVLEETGGIFAGMILQDDSRPTFLKQLGYSSFVLDYATRHLQLSRQSLLLNDPNAMIMYDLAPFGPNLHHYALECQAVTLYTGKEKIDISNRLSRPVVVVIDSGLTGCVFSDSWKEDLPCKVKEVRGAELQLGSQTLQSKPEYWYLSCFRLPWFLSEENHPHIIAAGATFLNGATIVVDSNTRRLRVDPAQTEDG
jgi:hypothetical protein